MLGFKHNLASVGTGHLPIMPVNARDRAGTSRDKQGQGRDKAGTSRDKAGINRDKQGQAGTVPVCPCLSLFVPALSRPCPCLSMLVPALSLALTGIIGKYPWDIHLYCAKSV